MMIKCSACGYDDHDTTEIIYKNKQIPICPDCKTLKEAFELMLGKELGIRRIDNGD